MWSFCDFSIPIITFDASCSALYVNMRHHQIFADSKFCDDGTNTHQCRSDRSPALRFASCGLQRQPNSPRMASQPQFMVPKLLRCTFAMPIPPGLAKPLRHNGADRANSMARRHHTAGAVLRMNPHASVSPKQRVPCTSGFNRHQMLWAVARHLPCQPAKHVHPAVREIRQMRLSESARVRLL